MAEGPANPIREGRARAAASTGARWAAPRLDRPGRSGPRARAAWARPLGTGSGGVRKAERERPAEAVSDPAESRLKPKKTHFVRYHW